MIEKLIEPVQGTPNELWHKKWLTKINELVDKVNELAETTQTISDDLENFMHTMGS